MGTASRPEAPPAAVRGAGPDTPGPERPAVPGSGIGIPQIPSRAAVAPAPVPSLGDDVAAPPPRAVPAAAQPDEAVPDARPTPAPVSFPPGVAAKLGYYVYLLVDPRTGRPFFVGRGRGDRCHRHVQAARGGPPSDDGSSGFPLLDRIREAEADGRTVRVEILRHGLSAGEADLIEASVADALGLAHPTRLGPQRQAAVEVGATLAKRAKFKPRHQVVLLRRGPHGVPTGYDSVRHGWRIGRRWIDTGSPRAPQWAVVVSGHLVDAVFRIDAWEPSPNPSGVGGDRFSFVGTPDPELDERYAGRSVASYLGTGTPSAVTYVWCGPHWVNTAQ
jgi:hypothetical protein